MKNKKGEIATLLTLGLVVVGTLITLGTSLFVSNKKTNLASNSMAAGTNNCCIRDKCKSCGAGKSQLRWAGKYSSTCSANNLETCTITSGSTCVTDSSCTAPAGQAPAAAPAADTKNNCCIRDKCKSCGAGQSQLRWTGKYSSTCSANGYENCSITSGSTCVSDSSCAVAGQPAAQGVDCGMTVSFASQDCAFGYTTEGCKTGTAKCKGSSSSTTSPAGIPGDDSTANQITTSTVTGEGQSCCFQKKGKVYVYSTYETMVNNDMLDDNGAPDCARQSAAVIKSYQADPIGAFVCSGGTQNMTAIADYNAANPIEPEIPEEDIVEEGADNCIKRVGFKCSSAGFTGSTQTFDYYKSTAKGCESNTVGGSCYGTSPTSCSEEWNAFVKTQCSPGAGSSSCTKHTGFKCSSAGYWLSSKTFDYYKSNAAGCESNTVGGSCYGTSASSCSTEWNAFLKSQCSGNTNDQIQCDHLTCDIGQTGDYYRRNISGTNHYYSSDANCKGNISGTTSLTTIKSNQCTGGNPAVLPVDNKCEKVTCPLGKTGEYYRGKPSTNYLYYNTAGECRDNIGGSATQNTVINKKCTTTVIDLNPNDPLNLTASFQQPFQANLTNADLSNTQIQFNPDALVIVDNTRLGCHTPTVDLTQINNFMQGQSNVNICGANENITIIPDFSGDYPFGKPQCCPK